jgi:putative endonuclease
VKQHNYYVYIVTNPGKTVLYVGVTNNLERRLTEHFDKRGQAGTFAGRYYCYQLLYFERHASIQHAIEREKETKLMKRADKDALIRTINPGMVFLKL